MRQRTSYNVLAVIVAIAALYFFFSITAYRFRHPEQTETQLFLHIPDAMEWK